MQSDFLASFNIWDEPVLAHLYYPFPFLGGCGGNNWLSMHILLDPLSQTSVSRGCSVLQPNQHLSCHSALSIARILQRRPLHRLHRSPALHAVISHDSNTRAEASSSCQAFVAPTHIGLLVLWRTIVQRRPSPSKPCTLKVHTA